MPRLAQCHIDRGSNRRGGWPRLPRYRDPMLDLNLLDLEEIAAALGDQADYEHRWLINPQTGQVVFWTSDTGIDALPSYVWYQDMADFTEWASDDQARRDLARAIEGKGAFRRFKDVLHQKHPHLLPAWQAFRETRAQRHAVDWLVDNSLIDDDAATRFLTDHPEPNVP